MKQIIEKHSLILRISHWLNVLFLGLMIWSGILIYWAEQAYFKVGKEIGPFSIHHRLAEGMGWHFFIMWPFTLNGLVYLIFQLKTGGWREVVPSRKDLKNSFFYLLHDLKIKKGSFDYQEKFNPIQKIAYTSAILMAMGSILTGLAIYKPVQLGWLTWLLGGYEAARFEHFFFMAGFVIFITVHLIQVARAGWNNFRAMVAGYEIK